VEVKKVEGIRISIPKKLPGRRFIGFESISRIVSKYIKPEDEERVEQEIRELLKKEGYTRF
jgi:hypothetical protein